MKPRPLIPADLDAIDTLNPPDWPPFRATFERYFELACCHPFGIEEQGILRAMGTLISFGSSAWIAQLITHPSAQGRGLGKSVMQFLMDEAGRRGIATLSLVATEQGYPLYAKLGFRVEGHYGFWTREAPAPAEPEAGTELRRWSDDAAGTLFAVDRWVSGEDRSSYFSDRTSDGLVAASDGFFLPRVGEGLVVARNDKAGVPLFQRRLDGASRVVIPAENQTAQRIAESRGFKLHHEARRMVLGPSLNRHPEGLWSRIAGNLG